MALLASLLAIALMTLLVIDFTTTSALSYRAAFNQANELRAEYLARSGVNVGLAALAESSMLQAMSKTPVDSLADPWAMPFPPIPVAGGTVTLSIVDDARKLNINRLVNPSTGQPDPAFTQILERLFALINVPPNVLPALVDWLDPDSIESPGGGAEADFYLHLIPPYEPRNGPMPTIGDLRQVRGVTPAIFLRLSQFLTVMPEPRVNVNTAPPQVLASLTPDLYNDQSAVQEIVQARAENPFTAVTDVMNLSGLPANSATVLPQLLTVQSDYFTITGVGTYAGARKMVVATFRRNLNGSALLMNWYQD